MSTIDLRKLKLTGFGPFIQPQTIPLTGPSGLVHIYGDNQVDSELQGNGVGKTHLFDAITFVLYGKTADGVRGPDLVNWTLDGDGAELKLELRKDGIPHTITRAIRPNRLTLMRRGEQAKPVEQHDIDRLIGRKLEPYLASVHYPQGIDSFLDLGPTGQLDLMAELLELDQYVRAADIAADEAKAQAKLVAEADVEIASINGKLLILKERRDELDNEESKFLRKRFRFLLSVDREIEGWRRQAEVSTRKISNIKDQIHELRDSSEVDAFHKQANAALHKRAIETSSATTLRTRRAQLVTALRETFRCPLCNRPFDDAEDAETHAKNELKLIDKRLRQHDEAAAALKAENENATKRWLNASKELDEQLNVLNNQLRELERAHTEAQTTIGELKKRKTEMLDAENPYDEQMGDTDDRIAGMRSQLSRRELRSHTAIQRERLYSFWVKGFKDLRLTVVEAALLQLTLSVNATLDRLGLPQWRLAVDAESITKAGTVKRGMKITVVIDGHERPVTRLSYGERQRLRIAVALGMSDMIDGVSGTQFNIELMDEPTSWLSQAGVESLLTVLDERAKLRNRRILLADHRVHAWPFTERWLVTKTAEGASVECL
jgi:DNA repair exonuclease SbcCD ATPase subunit